MQELPLDLELVPIHRDRVAGLKPLQALAASHSIYCDTVVNERTPIL